MKGHSELTVARLLPRTWQPFFQRFGRMTPIQLEAVNPILKGEDVLLCSPTSSGKTEAVCAPMVERYLATGKPWQICYISPTRALVNDLFHRLEDPINQMGLTLSRQTGEHRHNLWSRPELVITTPESFDSMMCRGRSNDGYDHSMNTVRAVVLDEIHLLHGTPRGEQICWLLHRLKKMRGRYFERGLTDDDKVQVIALSATIPDPFEVMKRYLGPESKSAIVGSNRTIETIAVNSPTMSVSDMLKAHIEGPEASNKILVFCNSRNKVDNLASTMLPIASSKGYAVRTHHGSLSKALREQTEDDAQRLKRIIIFATSTLEIGIDIGDIDLIVLDGPPPDLMSFLQRIGRGNRRTQTTRVMITARSPGDLYVQYAMVEAAREGWYPPTHIGRCYSVINQQIASYIFQSPGKRRSRGQIEGLFGSALGSEIDIAQLLNVMLEEGELQEVGRMVTLGEYWQDKSEAMGGIHSNIEGKHGITLIDSHTGQKLMHGLSQVDGDFLQINGSNARVVSRNNLKVEVIRSLDKKHVNGSVKYLAWGAPSTSSHPALVRHYLGMPSDVWPVVEEEEGYYTFHLHGPTMYLFLNLGLQKGWFSVPGMKAVNEWYILTSSEPNPPHISYTPNGPECMATADDLDMAERILGRPYFNTHLPEDLRRLEVLSWFNPSEEANKLRTSHWDASIKKDDVSILRSFE